MINAIPAPVELAREQTYTTVDGRVLALNGLTEEQYAFFARCLEAYRTGEQWETFVRMARTENPVIRAAGGRITQAVWDHPLFQVVHDLEDRLGIQQGEMSPGPDDDLDRDPLADEWIPAVRAAEEKGVSLPGLHGAIKRGDVIAKRADRQNHLLVSVNSLARWSPDPVRQAARLGAAASPAS